MCVMKFRKLACNYKHKKMVTSKNKHPLEQVEHTIDIIEQVHLDARELFLFDNAPSHKKLVADALNVDRKNIHT